MDFDNAYQSISKDFMDGEWWFMKLAHERGRLYRGQRTMHWDTSNATALAKHELEFTTLEDTAIYVRFKVLEDGNQGPFSYFVIWTTTPWTIPFNLGVMVNPKATYCKVHLKSFKGEEQYWVMARDLVTKFLVDKLNLKENEDFSVKETFLGNTLKGVGYEHPFAKLNSVYSELKKQMPAVHTCLLTEEYVTTNEGTGVVHCAPGCGPEDYEVGYRNKIQPFNTVDESGVFRNLAPFDGLRAKFDDPVFVNKLDEQKAVVYSHPYEHEYPIGQRSKLPVVFRTTSQWFLKVEDLK